MKARKNANRIYIPIFLCILSLFMVQCSVPPSPVFQKDGQFYGKIEGQWGGRWWNYYHRGLSYARGKYWDHAIQDLQEAIERRSEDQRRARTYGLHILDNYFPHRELGIVYYHQDRFEEAISELELSLSQFESAKAKYFLNLARRDLLKMAGLDKASPRIFIAFPRTGFLTRFSKLTVSGEVMDDQYIASLSVNNQKIPIELCSPSIAFHQDIALKRGENKLKVEAIDLIGRKTSKEIVTWCDQEAPIIYIDRVVEDLSGQVFKIEGYISDLSGVAGFWINTSQVDLPGVKGGEFSIYLDLQDLSQPLVFQAVDGLGNRTSGDIRVSEIFETADQGKAHFPRIAFSGQNLEGFLPGRLAYSENADQWKPVIRLKDIPDQLTVDWDELFLEGEVRDLEGVKSITVNGVPLMTRQAKLVFFNFLVPLDIGENEIVIQAEAISGARETKRIHIERKLNDVQQIGSRLNLAILPFKYRGEREEIKSLLYDSMLQYFSDQARFQLVEREKIERLFKMVKEEKDENQSWIELGRLLTAEGVIIGSAYFYDEYLEIIARAVDTETTVILDSEEVFGPIQSLKDVHTLAEGLSLKFKQAFPLIDGRVVEMQADMVQIDLGKKDRILPYMKVIFFREADPVMLPGSARILEKRFIILGEGRIKKLYESSSDADLILEKGNGQVKLDDEVITK